MDMLHKIMDVAEEIDENFHEAFEKMEKAFHWREDCRQMADWQKDMATAHANFNVAGCAMVRGLMEQMEHTEEHHAVIPGIRALMHERMAKWSHKHAELKAMIDVYK